MKLVQRALWLGTALALCAAAQPTIGTNGIVNGASFVYEGLPNGNIAQGSIFSIFGTNLGPIAGVNATTFPLSTNLGGVSVQVTSGSTTVNAILLYVAAGQINAILPSAVPAGTANVTVTFNSATSNAQPITVVQNSFGVFATNQAGSGQAQLNNYVSNSSQPQNGATTPAHPGQVVILWGTGLGPVTFDETTAPGTNAKDMTDTTGAMVYIGGVAVKPEYAGRSPQFAGEDQINFEIPSSMAGACQVPVTVKVNGSIVSNTTTLSVAAEGAAACSDAFNLLPTTSSQTFRLGGIVLTSSSETIAGTSLKIDAAAASFLSISSSSIGTQQSGGFGVSTFGACSVYTYNGTSTGSGGSAQITYLDAGSALTLTLPDNSTKTLTKSLLQGVYTIPSTGTTLPQPFLIPGKYTINVPGGTAVGPFQASLTVPAVLTWTNMATVAGSPVDRTKGLQVTWTGGDPADAVWISGTSANASQIGAGFYCLAKDSDGQFTIPSDVLSQLPGSTVNSGISSGTLSIGDYPTLTKSNISPVPSGLDFASFVYYFWSATSVTYQ